MYGVVKIGCVYPHTLNANFSPNHLRQRDNLKKNEKIKEERIRDYVNFQPFHSRKTIFLLTTFFFLGCGGFLCFPQSKRSYFGAAIRKLLPFEKEHFRKIVEKSLLGIATKTD